MYTRMPPYILLKNTATGDVKATPYGSLEELRSWLESELGSAAPGAAAPAVDNSELQTKIKTILETNSLGSSPLASAIDALFSSAPQENGGMSPEYRKNLKQMYEVFEVAFTTERNKNAVDEEYDLFNKHPEFEHYALLSNYTGGFLLPENYNKAPIDTQIICDLRDKKLIYKVSPETCRGWGKYGRQFIKTNYYHVVKALYDMYGTVLPKLAYMIVTSYFQFNTMKWIFDSDQCETDKVWVNTFVDKFFVRGEGKAMKRSDFIDALNAHFDTFIKNHDKDRNIAMGFPATIKSFQAEYFQKWRAESELFKSPDKVLGLPMVRRAAGMYIVGIAPINAPINEATKWEETEQPHPTYDKVVEHFNQDIIEWSNLIIHKTPFNQEKGFGIANIKFKGDWVGAQIYVGDTLINTINNVHGCDSFYMTSEGRCLPFTGNCENELIKIRFQTVGPCSFSYDIVSCNYYGAEIYTKDYKYNIYNHDDKININEPIEELWVEPSKPLRNVILRKPCNTIFTPKHCCTREDEPLYKFFPKCILNDAKIQVIIGEEDTTLKTFAKVYTVLKKTENGWQVAH